MDKWINVSREMTSNDTMKCAKNIIKAAKVKKKKDNNVKNS